MGIGARWTICKSQNCSKYSLIINPLLHNKNNQSFLSWSVMKQLKAILSNYLEREILCIGCAVYSVVSIKRTGSLNYFEVFYHPELFFHALNEIFLPPWSFFHALNEIFAPPCSLITSCLLNRYYRVLWSNQKVQPNNKISFDSLTQFIHVMSSDAFTCQNYYLRKEKYILLTCHSFFQDLQLRKNESGA